MMVCRKKESKTKINSAGQGEKKKTNLHPGWIEVGLELFLHQ